MKNIRIYQADKYSTPEYTKVEENIYKGRNPFCNGNIWERDELYLTIQDSDRIIFLINLIKWRNKQ